MGLHRGPELGQGAQHCLFKQHTSVESSSQVASTSPSSPARGSLHCPFSTLCSPFHEHPRAFIQRCLYGHPLFNACVLREEREQSSSVRSLPCSEPSAGSPSSPESDPQASLTGLGRPSSRPQPSLWLPPPSQTCPTCSCLGASALSAPSPGTLFPSRLPPLMNAGLALRPTPTPFPEVFLSVTDPSPLPGFLHLPPHFPIRAQPFSLACMFGH